MAVQLLGLRTKFTDDQGRPLVGGKVHTFYAGTCHPKDTYKDPAKKIPNTNPVILDDTGSADIFLDGSYLIRICDKNCRIIEEQDNVRQPVGLSDFEQFGFEISQEVNNAKLDLEKIKEKTLIVESIADLSTIKNPKDGLRVYVKSYHAGLNKGGGHFVYDSSKVEENDGGLVLNGWVRDTNDKYITPSMFGAYGDGIADDTDAVQKTLDKTGAIYFPPGTYSVSSKHESSIGSATHALDVRSNSIILFNPNAKVVLQPNGDKRYAIFYLDRVDNVTAYNCHLVGDRDEHLNDAGEWGHCIGIYGGSNISFYDSILLKGWGDGAYISSHYATDSSSTIPANIKFIGGLVKDNSRNGISVVAVNHGVIRDIKFVNNDRTLPCAGVDVEPFTSSTGQHSGRVSALTVSDCSSYGGKNGFNVVYNYTDIGENITTLQNLSVFNSDDCAYSITSTTAGDTIIARNLYAENIGNGALSCRQSTSEGVIDIDGIRIKNSNIKSPPTDYRELHKGYPIGFTNIDSYKYDQVAGNISIKNIWIDCPQARAGVFFKEFTNQIDKHGYPENVVLEIIKCNSETPFATQSTQVSITGSQTALTKKMEYVEDTEHPLKLSSGAYLNYVSSELSHTSFRLPGADSKGVRLTFKCSSNFGASINCYVYQGVNKRFEYLGTRYKKLSTDTKDAWIAFESDGTEWRVVDVFGDWLTLAVE